MRIIQILRFHYMVTSVWSNCNQLVIIWPYKSVFQASVTKWLKFYMNFFWRVYNKTKMGFLEIPKGMEYVSGFYIFNFIS